MNKKQDFLMESDEYKEILLESDTLEDFLMESEGYKEILLDSDTLEDYYSESLDVTTTNDYVQPITVVPYSTPLMNTGNWLYSQAPTMEMETRRDMPLKIRVGKINVYYKINVNSCKTLQDFYQMLSYETGISCSWNIFACSKIDSCPVYSLELLLLFHRCPGYTFVAIQSSFLTVDPGQNERTHRWTYLIEFSQLLLPVLLNGKAQDSTILFKMSVFLELYRGHKQMLAGIILGLFTFNSAPLCKDDVLFFKTDYPMTKIYETIAAFSGGSVQCDEYYKNTSFEYAKKGYYKLTERFLDDKIWKKLYQILFYMKEISKSYENRTGFQYDTASVPYPQANGKIYYTGDSFSSSGGMCTYGSEHYIHPDDFDAIFEEEFNRYCSYPEWTESNFGHLVKYAVPVIIEENERELFVNNVLVTIRALNKK